MSSPASSPSAAPPSVTRQQLDELDALLQRMLELPAQALEKNPDAAEPAPFASLSVLEPAPELPETAPAATLLHTDPPVTARSAVVRDEEASVAAETPPPVWLWPVVWGNRAFDVGVGQLGWFGRWLQRPTGRTLLGWMGLMLSAAAVALLVYDWIRTRW